VEGPALSEVEGTAPLVDCQNVTVYRGQIRALDRLTLSIAAGEHVAILGPNGCGKSTFIKTLTRECYPAIEEPPSTLRIMGRDRWSVVELRAMLGIVSQDLIMECTRGMSSDFADFPRRVTGRDTVLSGFFSSIGIWKHHHVTREMERKTDEILDRLEIAHLASRHLHELSSGEARRLVIGRALVHDPAALVLDEVANSLDLRAAHQLRETTRAIAQSGVALVIVTHHLPEIIPEVDRVILMKEGRVVADGPKERLLTSHALSDVFGMSIDVGQRDGYFHAW
jgi:iron complex transport system ATP-binding protein